RAARAVRHGRRAGRRRVGHPHGVADAVLRAHRDRQIAGLAGKPGSRPRAASRRRVRCKSLHQAGGAGGGARAAGGPARARRGRAGRPVKIALGMDEQFTMITRHPTTFRIKSGVSKDGKLTARQCEVLWNGGAYADIGPRVTQKSGFTAPGPYDIDNVKIDSYELYTNRTPAGALRGFGIPQLVWADEGHTDLI